MDNSNGPALWKRIVAAPARLIVWVAESFERHPSAGPVLFLSVSTMVALSLVVNSLYTPSFAVSINGEQMAVVADKSSITETINHAEAEAASILGYEFPVAEDVDYQYGVIRRTDLTGQEEIDVYLQNQLEDINEHMRQYEVFVDGVKIGTIKDASIVDGILEEIEQQYVTENTVDSALVEDVTVETVYAEGDLMTANELFDALNADSVDKITYEVVAGDTVDKIAREHDMTMDELMALNPGKAQDDIIYVGDTFTIRQRVPVVSVRTTEHQVYNEVIPIPTEVQEDASMYKGDSKVISEGSTGEKTIEADVVYINGAEQSRNVTSETIITEATPYIKVVGTKEKPKTASTGTYSWPVYGRISSGFGGRYIFGSYGYHEGIDIVCSYGTPVLAADGGTVTQAGYSGSYGNLVVITHDNGTKTYYAHNSSLLVSVGQKVYKGQAVAKAGSTGRSTGVHCHFGVMVGGSFRNPLGYLP